MNAPLLVYVSAKALSINHLCTGLISPTAIPREGFIPDLLPHGHHYVGRPLSRGGAHEVFRSLVAADIMFVWLEHETMDFVQGVEIGYAYSLGIPLIVGAPSGDLLTDLSSMARLTGVSSGIRRAYESLMSDADMLRRDVWEPMDSPHEAVCIICSGTAPRGSATFTSRKGEVCHKDCFVKHQELKGPHEAIFTSELVAALRQENARLEQDYNSLYEEYQKWVHP